MWTSLLRPLRQISQIVTLLTEQNSLLREIHIALTGTHAATPKVRPPMTAVRKRSANDVWQRTPLSSQRAEDNERNSREVMASHATPSFSTDDTSPTTPPNNGLGPNAA